MNPEEFVIKMANGVQCATLAGKVAVELTKAFEDKLSFSQAQVAITDVKQIDVKKMAEKIKGYWYISIFSLVILFPIGIYIVESKSVAAQIFLGICTFNLFLFLLFVYMMMYYGHNATKYRTKLNSYE